MSLPSATQFPACVRCGSAVEPGVEYCAVCEDLPRNKAPQASIETAPQKEPPYHTEGNFRRPNRPSEET